jgi:RHS repeat-associated protein
VGHLVRVVDTHAGAITADHSYTWCGNVRCLAHDNTQSGSPVSTQYFAQGAIIGGTSYYYVKDELGSVSELVSSTGTVASQYTYDPYGNQTTVSGNASDIGYAGYFTHAVSGLDFTLFRAYDPTHARWLNRDPIGETGGINLYAYVDGNPTDYSDPSGQCPWCIAAGIGSIIGAGFNAYNNYNAYQNGQITGEQYFYDIALGAETGALAALPGLGGLGSAALIGGLTAGANEGLQELENGNICLAKIGLAGTVGAAGSLLGPLGTVIGGRIPTAVIGNLATATRGYPNAGGLVGFTLSSIVSGLPIPEILDRGDSCQCNK